MIINALTHRSAPLLVIIQILDTRPPANATIDPDEQALSESELESKRAALLAQLNEQMEE